MSLVIIPTNPEISPHENYRASGNFPPVSGWVHKIKISHATSIWHNQFLGPLFIHPIYIYTPGRLCI